MRVKQAIVVGYWHFEWGQLSPAAKEAENHDNVEHKNEYKQVTTISKQHVNRKK